MSFILDALRKSEHERQRQEGPGIADLRVASPARSRQPLWALVLGALVLVNIAVVVALVLRNNAGHQPAAPAPAASETSAAAPATAVAPAPVVAPSITAPPAAAPVPPANELPGPAPGATGTALSEVADEASEPTLRAPPAAPAAAVESSESYASLPTLGDVTLQGASLPDLHLDLHVYASRPADRFVFINTRKYREGGQTPDGTTIERITPDGVVLNHRGVRFLLPRQ